VWSEAFVGEGQDFQAKTVQNNFEVTDLDFFLSPEVTGFADAITRSFGIYKWRWGDAILRYLTIALYANPDEVIWTENDPKYPYKHDVQTC